MMKGKTITAATEKFRFLIQLAFTLLINGYAIGFVKGTIYTGAGKIFCVPVLNCYSCPGALFACPIGALQAVAGGYKRSFSFYAAGTILLFGIVFGRLICGFLCPFGLVQDLLHKIPHPRLKQSKVLDSWLRYLKYIVALLLVFLLPALAANSAGVGDPYFCKYLCPAGMLEGGIPLTEMNENLKAIRGFLFDWKLFLLLLLLAASILVYRPFCKYLCPLGAIYGLCNRFSLFSMRIRKERCTGCKACERSCPMQVPLLSKPNSSECIRCGKCKSACGNQAIAFGFSAERGKQQQST